MIRSIPISPECLAKLRSCAIIAIDGDQGAGKSSFARQLKECIGADIVSVDDLLVGSSAPYTSQVQSSALKHRLSSARLPVVVEGVCLLDVLESIEATPDVMFFFKLHRDGSWGRERYLKP